MSHPVNPVDIENAIRGVTERMAKGVAVCDERYRAFLDADRAYDRAYALAYLSHGGDPAHERRYHAESETQAEREARDAAYRHADRLSRALENELRAWQSVGASVRAMYAVAGTGER